MTGCKGVITYLCCYLRFLMESIFARKVPRRRRRSWKEIPSCYCLCSSNLIDWYSSYFPFFSVLVKPEKTRLTINSDITKPVQFGSFVTFNCTTHARPDPDGYKFYRGQELLSSSGSGLFDLRLQRSGLYSCLPFNSAGDGDQASLKIIVDGRLRLVVKTFNSLEKSIDHGVRLDSWFCRKEGSIEVSG